MATGWKVAPRSSNIMTGASSWSTGRHSTGFRISRRDALRCLPLPEHPPDCRAAASVLGLLREPAQRILIVSDAWKPQVNGVVRTLATLSEELAAMGHAVDVIGPDRFLTLPC